VHVHLTELIAALSRTGQLRIRALVDDPVMRSRLHELDNVMPVAEPAVLGADVIHRPFQVSNAVDLRLFLHSDARIVITSHDLIAYRNPSYFHSQAASAEYRQLTRRALAIADHVVVPSAHALAEMLGEELVDVERASVVSNGVDHALTREPAVAAKPSAAARLPHSAQLILCLGTDYRHKNRMFALRVLEELVRRDDFDGCLVFAGPHMKIGSSAADETDFLRRLPRLAERTIDVGSIPQSEKRWLLDRAGLVIYPTVYEGFGLVPFEAAAHGVPCMWAAGSALQEILPDTEATIVPWNAAYTAEQAIELLRNPQRAERNVAAIRTAGAQATWDRAARRMIRIYEETCDEPRSPAGAVARMAPSISEDGLRLVGPGGALPDTLERPMLALATHPRIGAPVFGAIRAGYDMARFVRRLSHLPKHTGGSISH
jgi:glycosyltransferase involved in cell wall biosynthesis